MLPTQLGLLLLNQLLGQLRQHKSLPMDRQLWRPRREIFHSAKVLQWVRQGVFRQIITIIIIIIIILDVWKQLGI